LMPVVAPAQVASQESVKSKKQRKAKPGTAVETIAKRQILNAIDAGEGDLLTRGLRQKVVEEPANVEARLALAAAYEKQGAPELAIVVVPEKYGMPPVVPLDIPRPPFATVSAEPSVRLVSVPAPAAEIRCVPFMLKSTLGPRLT